MSLLNFKSAYIQLPGILSDYTPRDIEEEPQFFSADLAWAWDKGGPITRDFLIHLPEEWRLDKSVILDSRVHMLMPGWLPCIPGWHLDDIPRTRQDGQPDHSNPSYRAEHILALVGDCSRTAFLVGDIQLHDVPDGQLNIGGVCPETSIYGKWHEDIELALDLAPAGTLRVEHAPERRLLLFNDQSFHRGVAATSAGWRWFARVTRGSERQVLNKQRSQTQVYLPAPNVGW